MNRPKKGTKRELPAEADARIAIIHLKGSPAYSEWLDAIHRTTHIPKASLFRIALAEYAARNGHPAPPEM